MSQLETTINGRRYTVACEDGQEEHLGRLADYVKTRVEELAESVGQIGDARLLLMVSLLIADELSDAYAELAVERGESEQKLNAGQDGTAAARDEEAMAATIETVAERIEAIAARLEAT